MSLESMKPDNAKKPYTAPRVVDYGEVRTLTQAVSALSSEGSSGTGPMKPIASDRRVKANIVRVGDHPFGIGLYLFDYLPAFRDQWGHGRQFGVMADEVETVMPEAVSTHANGYKVVDYTLLGISRTRH